MAAIDDDLDDIFGPDETSTFPNDINKAELRKLIDGSKQLQAIEKSAQALESAGEHEASAKIRLKLLDRILPALKGIELKESVGYVSPHATKAELEQDLRQMGIDPDEC